MPSIKEIKEYPIVVVLAGMIGSERHARPIGDVFFQRVAFVQFTRENMPILPSLRRENRCRAKELLSAPWPATDLDL